MATPGKLRDEVAAALGLQAKSVDVHLRNLREAGLISKEKRGTGAAQVTPADAAALLVAVLGSNFVKDSVHAYRTIAMLKLNDHRISLAQSGGRLGARFRRKLPLTDLKAGHTLLEAVAVVLASSLAERVFFPQIAPEDFTASRQTRRRRKFEYEPYLSLNVFAPYGAAILEFGGIGTFRDARLYGELPASFDGSNWNPRRLGAEKAMVTVRFAGLSSLRSISKALRSDVLSES